MASRLIVHLVHSLDVGGLENGVVNLVNIRAPGFRHAIVTLTQRAALRSRLPADVDVISLDKRGGHEPRLFLSLVQTLRRLRPALVHSRNWGTFDGVVAARMARVPAVVHGEHGRDATDPDGTNWRRKQLRRMCAPLVDRFVTVSEDLHRWLVEDVGIPRRKVKTIQNGVDTARFSPRDRGALRAALGLGPDQIVVGTVGRLDPVKNHAGLLRAFVDVRRQHPDAVLVIVGDGPGRAELDALTHALPLGGSARLVGERNDVPAVLAALDVFVLPSIAEGMSNTLLEAMATGLPIVATRVGGNPELVVDGVNGTLVPREDPALAKAIATYVEDAELRIAHGRASRHRALERFALERMHAAYVSLYAELSPEPAGGH